MMIWERVKVKTDIMKDKKWFGGKGRMIGPGKKWGHKHMQLSEECSLPLCVRWILQE
jgi:hypothetical protein